MPALAVPFPIINGHAFSYASVEIFWGPLPVAQKAFKSINYGAKLDPGEIRGTDPHVIGYTRGTHSSDGDAEAYLAQWELLKATLGFAGVGSSRSSCSSTRRPRRDLRPRRSSGTCSRTSGSRRAATRTSRGTRARRSS